METGLIILIVLISLSVLLPLILFIVLTVFFMKHGKDGYCLEADGTKCELNTKIACDKAKGTHYDTLSECEKNKHG